MRSMIYYEAVMNFSNLIGALNPSLGEAYRRERWHSGKNGQGTQLQGTRAPCRHLYGVLWISQVQKCSRLFHKSVMLACGWCPLFGSAEGISSIVLLLKPLYRLQAGRPSILSSSCLRFRIQALPL